MTTFRVYIIYIFELRFIWSRGEGKRTERGGNDSGKKMLGENRGK